MMSTCIAFELALQMMVDPRDLPLHLDHIQKAFAQSVARDSTINPSILQKVQPGQHANGDVELRASEAEVAGIAEHPV